MDLTPHLQEPYRARPVRFLELWETGEWRLKVYTISAERVRPRAELVAAAKELALRHLPRDPQAEQAYGVGFLGIHEGRGWNFVFLGWWAMENELCYHVYLAPSDRPTEFTYANPTGRLACVWDLQLLGFERKAWVERVLANSRGPDLNAYLARQMNDDI